MTLSHRNTRIDDAHLLPTNVGQNMQEANYSTNSKCYQTITGTVNELALQKRTIITVIEMVCMNNMKYLWTTLSINIGTNTVVYRVMCQSGKNPPVVSSPNK